MPDYYASSFTRSNGFEDSSSASFGSTQSTEATEPSDYGNTVTGARQTRTSIEDSILESVGYAGESFRANPAYPNPGTENYCRRASVQANGPYYVTQEEDRSVYEAPWSPLLHQFDPYPANQRPSASRPRQLEYQSFTVYDVQTPFVLPLPSGSNYWPPGQYSNSVPSQAQASFGPTQPSFPSSSGRPSRVPIDRLSSTPSSSRAVPAGQEPKRRYWCQVPGCNVSCSRPEDLLGRHYRTCHGECASGPFWLCEVCGHWEYESRRDKMEQHCREKHDVQYCDQRHKHAAHGCYPCHSVESVGQQNHEVRSSTTSKLTRRRKKPLP